MQTPTDIIFTDLQLFERFEYIALNPIRSYNYHNILIQQLK